MNNEEMQKKKLQQVGTHVEEVDDDEEDDDDDEDDDVIDMNAFETLADAFEETFAEVESPGDFAIGGVINPQFGLPGLELHSTATDAGGSTLIGLPLCEPQAQQIISIASKSPFGRKEETLFDDSVRKSWQLDPSQFRITNPDWPGLLQLLVDEQIVSGLGLPQNRVRCSLYKLLLYEKGGHFKPHRDTEKEDGMFGTLIIQLPSVYEGGEIIVQHRDRSHTFDFHENARFKPYFAAFYADCEHQITEVTSGYRLCLIYNLLYTGRDSIVLGNQGKTLDLLKQICNEWVTGFSESRLVYILEHHYSSSGLSFRALKGHDAVIGQELKRLKEQGILDVYVVILKKHESGGGYSSYDMEVEDTSYSVTHWIDTDDNRVNMKDLSVFESDIFPEHRMENMKFDKESIDEATGNEGATIDRWYKNAALVYWPVEKRIDIWAGLGSNFAIGKLEEMVRASDPRSSAFCRKIISNHSYDDVRDDHLVSRLHRVIEQLNDLSLAQYFIVNEIKGPTRYSLDFSANMMRILSQLVSKFSWNNLKQAVKVLFSNRIDRVDVAFQTLSAIQNSYTEKDQIELLREAFSGILNSVTSYSGYGIDKTVNLVKYANQIGMESQAESFLQTMVQKQPSEVIHPLLVRLMQADTITVKQREAYAISLTKRIVSNQRSDQSPKGSNVITLFGFLNQLNLTDCSTALMDYIIANPDKIDAYTLLRHLMVRPESEHSQETCKKLAISLVNKLFRAQCIPSQEFHNYLAILNELELSDAADAPIKYIGSRGCNESLVVLASIINNPQLSDRSDQIRQLATIISNNIPSEPNLPSVGNMIDICTHLYVLKLTSQLKSLVDWLTKQSTAIILTFVKTLVVRLAQNGINMHTEMPLAYLRTFCVSTIQHCRSGEIQKLVGYSLNVSLNCHCQICQSAQRELNNPIQQKYELRSRLQDRKHVETVIRAATNELTYETITRGSPHTFVCTKVLNATNLNRRCVAKRQEILNEVVSGTAVSSGTSTQLAPTNPLVRGPSDRADSPPAKRAKPDVIIIE